VPSCEPWSRTSDCLCSASDLDGPAELKAGSFSALDIKEQIEFSTFRHLRRHPPDNRWIYILTDTNPAGTASALERIIAEEKSDQFVLALIRFLAPLASGVPRTRFRALIDIAKDRVAKITDPWDRWFAADVVSSAADSSNEG
jgi:hypothetical protein